MLDCFFKTVNHFFGGFIHLFKPITDFRQQSRITHPLPSVCFTALMLFIGRMGARHKINSELRHSKASLSNYERLFSLAAIPHGDTVNDVFKLLDTEHVQQVNSTMIRHLIRSKALYSQRLLDSYFMIAIDGSGMLTYDYRHCDHCLEIKHPTKTLYYHPVLEAKLVTFNGFALSVMSEFVENPSEKYNKQDCELKAFKRLAERLHKQFPRLPICLLLDGLYAAGTVFQIARNYGWKYITVLKDDKIPSVTEEFDGLRNIEHQNRLAYTVGQQNQIKRTAQWVNDIEYKDTDRRKHQLHVLAYDEHEAGQSKHFKNVTNIQLHPKRIPAVAQAGRLRWNIENQGFNVQKNAGFNMEHAYSNHPNAHKIFYLFLQIAHTILQLIQKGNLLDKALIRILKTAQQLSRRILEAWRNHSLTQQNRTTRTEKRAYISFDSS